MTPTPSSHRKAIVGHPTGSFWLYSSTTGFDLTHPSTPTSPSLTPSLILNTTTQPIAISPSKTALVIIDMQNFFLSPFLGRPTTSKGLLAQHQLLSHAIPACRQAGIRIIWLNWGLTDSDLDSMPPATLRAFGFETILADDDFEAVEETNKEAALDPHGVNQASATAKIETSTGRDAHIYRGLGSDIGPVHLLDGTVVDGGRLLMRHAWNSALTPELAQSYHEGLTANPPDVWIHKNRMSGLWGAKTDCTTFLEQEGIKTLIFAGVNTDQCVAGSLTDAFTKGYDCVLLRDACGTTSPEGCAEGVEWNCARTWGFVLRCDDLVEGVGRMEA